MENTKIPKPSLKPPTRIAKPTTAKVLSVVPEGKVATQKAPLKKTSSSEKIHHNNVLRRRSKSVSDLRSLVTRPLLTNSKPLKIQEKPLAKIGQKRPALSKNDEENKPKVMKRIPDWDYKSRFYDLQKKYTSAQEEVKNTKSKIVEFEKLQEEVTDLRASTSTLTQQVQLLEGNVSSLTGENERLAYENSTIKTNLTKKADALQKLKDLHEKVQIENKENMDEIERLQVAVNEMKTAIFDLEQERDELKNAVKHLKQDVEDQDNLRRHLHNTIQDMKGNIRVFCRVRPPVTKDEIDKQLCAIFFPNEASLDIRKSRESVSTVGGKPVDLKQEFTFDKVFPPEANQAEVFEELAQLVQSALDGYNVCVFAYGQTGSGKTYTMQGSPDDHGMIPRTVDLIFQKIKKLSKTDWTYVVSASFLEIYNENIRDLLVPNSTHNYELRYNEGRGVTVTNLRIVPISTASELKNLIEEANKNRAVAATDFNEHSSRSHSVTKIYLEGHNDITKVNIKGSINLVDLAGSESARTTTAERLTETKNINKSLATLGNVMLALHNKDSHVPYRNSRLTFLLQSCLGGDSKTLMFVNISPFEECYNESINSLRFASKVKDVKTLAKRNKTYTQTILPVKT